MGRRVLDLLVVTYEKGKNEKKRTATFRSLAKLYSPHRIAMPVNPNAEKRLQLRWTQRALHPFSSLRIF